MSWNMSPDVIVTSCAITYSGGRGLAEAEISAVAIAAGYIGVTSAPRAAAGVADESAQDDACGHRPNGMQEGHTSRDARKSLFENAFVVNTNTDGWTLAAAT